MEHRKATREKKQNYKTRETWKAGSFILCLCVETLPVHHTLLYFYALGSKEDTVSGLMLPLKAQMMITLRNIQTL